MDARIRHSGINHKQKQEVMKTARKSVGNEVICELGHRMDATLLYTCAENFGFTDEQLRLLHLYFILNTKMLGYKYEMQDCPSAVSEHFLVQHGIDFDKWVDADNKLWDELPNKDKWVEKSLEEFNAYIKELAERRIKDRG